MRYFYDVNDLLFSLTVFAVVLLLLTAVFRCYLAAGGFKKPEFLRPGEDPPLHFPGIISGISKCGDRRTRPGSASLLLGTARSML